ncbi:hypothetical protein HELRODRAFT_175786 [Helobdella robusta]|uniref:RNase H type-1 domain-containing protein n=1 Tax=Helobdella robusta TaxID=6412 RepID=T1F9N7_HELRO|nr:hypothetical protein HELRODRAFT_175786 [Helobdella robusta]ESO00375.1 hypothetical protein HELRODRAFT_175786 [Helobdella robusta]
MTFSYLCVEFSVDRAGGPVKLAPHKKKEKTRALSSSTMIPLQLDGPMVFVIEPLSPDNSHDFRKMSIFKISKYFQNNIGKLNFIKIQQNRILIKIKGIHNNLNDNNGKKITLIWIPSHIEIQGNEEVDQLASQAHNIPISNLPIPHNDLRFWTKKIKNRPFKFDSFLDSQQNKFAYMQLL